MAHRETLEFIEWLRGHDQRAADRAPVGFHGLDLYSMFTSIAAVLAYLDRVDPALAKVARELNVGQLCRVRFDSQVYIVGFGTDHGSVAAAPSWGAEMARMPVRPAHPGSYERLCHDTERAAFLLHLREPVRGALRDELLSPRLERAIGVVYRPDTELVSHYFSASLPLQFDEYIWIDETHALDPLPPPRGADLRSLPETFPFGV